MLSIDRISNSRLMHTQILKYVTGMLVMLPFFSLAQTEGQDDLFDELDDITVQEDTEVIATFKSTRVLIGQSTERVRKGQLHFRVSHVFSKIIGIDNFFGLDNLNNMHLSFEYGLNDRIQLGLSRSNKPDKTYSGIAKLSLLRQKNGAHPFPFSFSYYGNLDYKSRDFTPEGRDRNFQGRLDYINQLLVSRKFGDHISLQVAPIWVHRNLTENRQEPNDIYSVGLGGRYLFSRSVSVNLEYYYTLPTFDAHSAENNMFSVGFDIETGGHVFQLYFTNAFALHPGKFAINQNGDFFNRREINFGFSLLREFNI